MVTLSPDRVGLSNVLQEAICLVGGQGLPCMRSGGRSLLAEHRTPSCGPFGQRHGQGSH